MADKHLAYSASTNTDLFDDDDPLAELARIVGFEPRSAAQPVPAQKQEPAFDLEDELLREFERYDAPRPLQSLDRTVEPVVPEPSPPFEGASATDVVTEELDAFVPAPEEVSLAELPPEAVALDGAVDGESHEVAVEDWAVEESSSELPELADDSDLAFAVEAPQPAEDMVAPVAKIGLPADSAAAAGRIADARSLMDELELSISTQPIVPPTPPARVPQWAAASIRLPLANFNAARREPPREEETRAEVVAPVVAPPPEAEFSEPLDLGFQPEHDRHEASELEIPAGVVVQESVEHGFDLAASARDGVVPSDAALTDAAYGDETESRSFDIDELLADIERYPVPPRAADAAAVDEPSAPVETRVAAPAPFSKASEPVVVAPPAEAIRAQRPASKPEPEGEDPFAGHDFELDLDGIELELADLDFSQAEQQAVVPERKVEYVEQPAPVVVAVIAPRPVAAPEPVRAIIPPSMGTSVAVEAPKAPVQRASGPLPVVPERPVAVRRETAATDNEQALPFDPSLISDPEDHPETVADMHVPALPTVELDEPVAVAPDYDFDIDAEMASLFEPRPEDAPLPPRANSASHAPVAVAAPAAAKAEGAQGSMDDLDEFEQALEEDFRRSYRDPVPRPENLARMTLESASVTADRRRARSMRGIAVAAGLIAVFGLGSYGVYAWLSGGAPLGVSSGEPRVIVADKDPVKVPPENPGGKTVPNQDKAVYDRVAGATTEEPKQKALVSSNEEPVDVVQKTLIPEALPMDDGDGAADDLTPTPAGETEDPRLLPDQDTADAQQGDDDQTPAVAPRRVRTMIVKPDGTLVARDEPAPAPAPSVAAATPAPAQAEVAPAPVAAAPADVQTTATNQSAAAFPATGNIASAGLRTSPVDSQPAEPAQPIPAANESAAPSTGNPAASVEKTAEVGDTAPVPTARPVDQPVNVVGTVTERGNVRTAAEAPAEVASANPVQEQPVAAAPAGGYGMQIASLPSEEEAKKTYASLSSKFGSVIGGRGVEIRKADIAGKGTFYRVRIPAGTKDEAAELCQRYRQAGGSCLISK
ncbi:SPOR domain-containing protein [Rhizobium sp. BK251]|uniref:SPOR domain-containing protein n=1 Tax=Rhizobium sp. BK251 TaxID=2512125 RepID=UPI0010F1DB84|nr:SPOR domain-containing protein [Rhizobium sp. BK251]TCL67278.1 sporulation related protein [Rhizobium sp. BK251]